MKLVTFNLRVSVDVDGINCFSHRLGMIYEKIKREVPDIICFQEVRENQLSGLETVMPDYLLVGQGREADYSGEGLYVAVRKATVQTLAFDSFWLSPKPHVPGSRFESQSKFPRICNVLRVLHRDTNRVFYVYNVHLDHISEQARVDAMHSILEHLKKMVEMTNFPAIIMGDFNAKPCSETIRICDTFDEIELINVTKEVSTTFHNYGQKAEKIDYIYVTKDIGTSVTETGIWDDKDNGIYLSDHYPVYMCIS